MCCACDAAGNDAADAKKDADAADDDDDGHVQETNVLCMFSI